VTRNQYVEKMKELGWPEDHISEQIKMHDDAANNGVNIPFEIDLFEAPKSYPHRQK